MKLLIYLVMMTGFVFVFGQTNDAKSIIASYPHYKALEDNQKFSEEFYKYMEWVSTKSPDGKFVFGLMKNNVKSIDALATIFHEKVEFFGWRESGHKFEDILNVDYYRKHYMEVYAVAHRKAVIEEIALLKYFASKKGLENIPEVSYNLVLPIVEHYNVPVAKLQRRLRYNPEYQAQVYFVTKKDIEAAISLYEAGGYKYKNRKKIFEQAVKFVEHKKETMGVSTLIESFAISKRKKERKKEEPAGIKVVRNYYATYAKMQPELLKEFFAHDIEWHIPGRHPLSGTKKGPDEVLAFFSQLAKAKFKAELIYLGGNDRYVVDVHRGWSNTRDRDIDMPWVLMYRIENGKIKEARNWAWDQHAADMFFRRVYGTKQENKSCKTDDIRKIVQIVNTIATAADRHDWQAVKNCFDDEVTLDYTSLGGGAPVKIKPEQIIAAWKGILPGFTLTQHAVTNHEITVKNKQANCFAYVTALHYIPKAKGGDNWIVSGYYNYHLVFKQGRWKVDMMRFTKTLIRGNSMLPVIAGKRAKVKVKKISFTSAGKKIVGNLYIPGDYEKGQARPAVIVGGSWTTVKEQMAGTYAFLLAQNGFITLAFDHRGFGESEGDIRDYESPKMKIEDFRNAITYLTTLEEVDKNRIAAFGVCASGGYLAKLAATEQRLKALAVVAAWMHDAKTVGLAYGGSKGVQERMEQGKAAWEFFRQTKKVKYVPSISTTDKNAAMFGKFDYYLNPKRGAIKEWNNRFALMSWPEWLTFDSIIDAEKIKIPVIIIHSRKAALPMNLEKFFQSLKGPKVIHWLTGSHFDYYDNEPKMAEAVRLIVDYFYQNAY